MSRSDWTKCRATTTALVGMMAILGGSLLLPTRMARAEVLEQVVAVVNEKAIFLSDLRRRAVPDLPRVMQQGRTAAERAALREELYDRILGFLIEEELFRQAAKRMQVSVTSTDIEQAIRNVRTQSGLEEDQFWEAVRSQGLTESQYRQDLRSQLLRMKVLNHRVRNRVNITETEVRRRYEEMLRKANLQLRFRASHCFFALPETAGATEVAAVRAEVDRTHGDLTVDALDACIETHGGGDLGWLNQGDLPEELEGALLALQPGEIADPVRGPSGYHVFVLHERERGDASIPSFEQAREEIFRQMLDQAMARQETLFLEELEREAAITRRL